MKQKEEEYFCGECCWFHGETTDGEGLCVDTNYPMDCVYCDTDACKDFVSRKEMRHHMAVILQFVRWATQKTFPLKYKPVDVPEVAKAAEFAYKYMKNFSKL